MKQTKVVYVCAPKILMADPSIYILNAYTSTRAYIQHMHPHHTSSWTAPLSTAINWKGGAAAEHRILTLVSYSTSIRLMNRRVSVRRSKVNWGISLIITVL